MAPVLSENSWFIIQQRLPESVIVSTVLTHIHLFELQYFAFTHTQLVIKAIAIAIVTITTCVHVYVYDSYICINYICRKLYSLIS